MTTKTNNADVILLDYYKGAYGPTIRLDTQSTESLMRIRDVFKKLVEGDVLEVRFHEVESVRIRGIKDLILSHVQKDRGLIRTVKTDEDPIFYWMRDSEGWKDCVGLIEGILNRPVPSHQYLTDLSSNDALIEVAFLENNKMQGAS